MFGLLDSDIEYIQKAFESYKEIDHAVIFGSRAIGNYKKGSDVDKVVPITWRKSKIIKFHYINNNITSITQKLRDE